MGPCPREFALVTTELRAAPTEPDIGGLGTSFLNTQLSNGPVVAHSAFLSRWGPDPPTSQELQGWLTAICFYEQKFSSFPQGRSPSWWPTVRQPRQGLCPHLGHPAQPPQPDASPWHCLRALWRWFPSLPFDHQFLLPLPQLSTKDTSSMLFPLGVVPGRPQLEPRVPAKV